MEDFEKLFWSSHLTSAPARAPAVLAPVRVPDVPKPRYPNDPLPDRSPDWLVATGNTDVYLFAAPWIDHASDSYWHSATRLPPGFTLSPQFPAGIQLGYKMFWERVGASQILPGPQTFIKQVTHKAGMTQTESLYFSSEIGAGISGFSAKLSQNLGRSITISNETDVTTTYQIAVQEGKTTVWTLWQLVEVYTLIDGQGNDFSYDGRFEFRGPWGMSVHAYFPTPRANHRTHQVVSDIASF